MTPRHLMISAALLALAAVVCSNPSASAAPDDPSGDADISVQKRGPIHEAYAQPYSAAPQPGLVAPKAPPDPIPEMPPDQKPEGDNVQWIPGYWNWDADRNDYLWVSGFWRAAPPDRKWVAGYWSKADNGWQWVSGYWGPATQQSPPLLDAPPQPLDTSPSVPAPDDNSLYVPGSWVPRGERYLWRPGFWQPERLGWVWVPAHYVWTPGGCVFVDGYWDYPLETRGVLFAPVVFSRPLWQTPGWCFRPRFVVGIDTDFFASLFVRPSCGQYYFGDYFGPNYLTAGFEPWCRFGPRHHDPLFGYYRWSHRREPDWLRHVGAVYAGRRGGEWTRTALVRPLSEFHGGLKLKTINRTQVVRHQNDARRIQEAGRRRVQAERPVTRGRTAVASPPSHAAPVIVNHQSADRGTQHHREVRPATPIVEHHAAKAPAVVHKPAPIVEHHAAKAPAVVHKPAAPRPAPAPARHPSPAPSHAAAHHIGPPAHHAPPAPTHSGGKGGHQTGGHKKK